MLQLFLPLHWKSIETKTTFVLIDFHFKGKQQFFRHRFYLYLFLNFLQKKKKRTVLEQLLSEQIARIFIFDQSIGLI